MSSISRRELPGIAGVVAPPGMARPGSASAPAAPHPYTPERATSYGATTLPRLLGDRGPAVD